MKGLLVDEEGDLIVENGTIKTGENTEQVAHWVVVANRGEFKEFPLIGGEIIKMINGTPDPMWKSNVKNMLFAAGVPVKRIKIEGSNITLE